MAMKSERLTTPLVRDGGELRPASWDEALERAATGFRGAIDDQSIAWSVSRTTALAAATSSGVSAARRAMSIRRNSGFDDTPPE